MLAANFANLGKQLDEIKEGGAAYLHIDVMDGVFVPALSFGMPVIKSIRQATDLIFDVHLMITEPIRYVEEFAKIGADIITVHLEACEDVEATLKKIKACGKKSGLSIKPGTPVESIKPYLTLVDMILVMSVEPGFGGQKYIEATTEKIRLTRQMIKESGLDIDLEVDGGINVENVKMVLEAGANVIVAGVAVFGEQTLEKTKSFMEILSEKESHNE